MEPEILFEGTFDEPTIVEILDETVEVFGHVTIINGSLLDLIESDGVTQ